MLAIRRAHMCADDAPLERQHGKLCLWKTTTHNLKFTSFIKEKCNQNIKTKLNSFFILSQRSLNSVGEAFLSFLYTLLERHSKLFFRFWLSAVLFSVKMIPS